MNVFSGSHHPEVFAQSAAQPKVERLTSGVANHTPGFFYKYSTGSMILSGKNEDDGGYVERGIVVPISFPGIRPL